MVDLLLAGDVMLREGIGDALSRGPREIADRFDRADLTLAHLESPVRQYEETTPARRTIGQRLCAPPSAGDQLRSLGIDVVTLAGNHTLDHGRRGLQATWRSLERAGVDHAGTGRSLDDARTATYTDVGGTTVAVVSGAVSFHGNAPAGESSEREKRPGVNPVRCRLVTAPETFREKRRVAERTGKSVLELDETELLIREPGCHYPFDHLRLDDSLEPGDAYREPLPRDRRALVGAVRSATSRADLVVVHLHNHAGRVGQPFETPSAAIRSLAASCAQSGADTVISQGCHVHRGAELIDHTPVVYGLGAVIGRCSFVPPRRHRVTPDASVRDRSHTGAREQSLLDGDAVVVRLQYTDGALDRLTLDPIRRRDGLPHPAPPDVERDVIDRYVELADRMNTELVRRDGRCEFANYP